MSDALVSGYDLVILDLDGVVYVGTEPVEGAALALTAVRALGVPIAFATNNASRRAAEVAELLRSVGVPAQPDEVTTSAAATAEYLAGQLPPGSPVLVVGAEALREELSAVGLRPVDTAEAAPLAVAQGYGPEVGWRHLAEATVAIRAGAHWVATNADRTLPSPRGPLPGNGSLVAALATALGRQPDVIIGKPAGTLFRVAAEHHRAQRPLVVGDRLDTDIEGANQARMDSLLVLTGVTHREELASATPDQQPTYVGLGLDALLRPGEPA